MLRLLAHEQLSSFGQISHEQTDSNAWESVLAQSLVQSYLMRWTAQAKLVQKNTGQRFPQGIAVNKQLSALSGRLEMRFVALNNSDKSQMTAKKARTREASDEKASAARDPGKSRRVDARMRSRRSQAFTQPQSVASLYFSHDMCHMGFCT